jgi:hypothetical protein
VRKRLAVFAVLAAAFAAPASGVATAAAAPIVAVKTCGAGYVHAYLPWGEKCLRAGEFCKIGNSAYRRYGFSCPTTGHLRRR